MKSKNYKPLIISIGITALEFIAFLIWGKIMNPGDEMGFFVITTYILFPLTTLILSIYLGFKNPIHILAFVLIMFAAQNFMPFILTDTFEVGLICLLTFVPCAIGAGVGIASKKLIKS